MKISGFIKELETQHCPKEAIAALVWLVEDVIERAEERGISIHEGQAREILEYIQADIPYDLGVFQRTLDTYTDEYLTAEEDCKGDF